MFSLKNWWCLHTTHLLLGLLRGDSEEKVFSLDFCDGADTALPAGRCGNATGSILRERVRVTLAGNSIQVHWAYVHCARIRGEENRENVDSVDQNESMERGRENRVLGRGTRAEIPIFGVSRAFNEISRSLTVHRWPSPLRTTINSNG